LQRFLNQLRFALRAAAEEREQVFALNVQGKTLRLGGSARQSSGCVT
jgi:hypothetical protein